MAAMRNTSLMTTVATGNNSQLSLTLMNLMHEFRHEVFIKRLGWTLPSTNGHERDQYDTPDAKYLVVSNSAGDVTACARLLPTTNSYMLPDLFPQLLGNNQTPRGAAIWELSRFAATVRQTHEGRVLSLSEPTLNLLNSVFDFARKQKVTRLILVTSIGIERLMLRAGVAVHRIAPPANVDGHMCVALYVEVAAAEPAEASSESVAA
jgi:N-acyl-L-homoserine lactone synthetase